MSKFLDEKGLQYFWTKIKTLMSSAINKATEEFLPKNAVFTENDSTTISSEDGRSVKKTLSYGNYEGTTFDMKDPSGVSRTTIGLHNGRDAASNPYGSVEIQDFRNSKYIPCQIMKGGDYTSCVGFRDADGLKYVLQMGIASEGDSANGALLLRELDLNTRAHKTSLLSITNEGISLDKDRASDSKVFNTNGGLTSLPEYSEGTLSVKQLQGKALDGKSNKTLVLGFDAVSGYTNNTSLDSIGKHNVILIGAGEEGVTDSTQQDDIYILSPSNINLATKNGSVKINSGSAVQISGKQAVNVKSEGDMDITAARAVTINGATGNLTLGDDFTRLSAASNKAFVRLGDNGSAKVHVVGSKMYFNDDTTNPEDNAWINISGNKVKINAKDGSGMIQTNATTGSEEVKFRAGTANTMRLNAPVKDASGNVTTPGGLRVFANLFALAEMATDLPTTLSETAKTTLNTKSVQSILGEMLDNAVVFRQRSTPTTLPSGRLYAYIKQGNNAMTFSPSLGYSCQNNGGSAALYGNMLRISYGDSVSCSIEATDSGDGGMLVDPNNNLYFFLKGKNYQFNFDKAIELGLLTEVDF